MISLRVHLRKGKYKNSSVYNISAKRIKQQRVYEISHRVHDWSYDQRGDKQFSCSALPVLLLCYQSVQHLLLSLETRCLEAQAVLLQALHALQSCWLHVAACAPNSLVSPAFMLVLSLLHARSLCI
jgi:hypothetical protein